MTDHIQLDPITQSSIGEPYIVPGACNCAACVQERTRNHRHPTMLTGEALIEEFEAIVDEMASQVHGWDDAVAKDQRLTSIRTEVLRRLAAPAPVPATGEVERREAITALVCPAELVVPEDVVALGDAIDSAWEVCGGLEGNGWDGPYDRLHAALDRIEAVTARSARDGGS